MSVQTAKGRHIGKMAASLLCGLWLVGCAAQNDQAWLELGVAEKQQFHDGEKSAQIEALLGHYERGNGYEDGLAFPRWGQVAGYPAFNLGLAAQVTIDEFNQFAGAVDSLAGNDVWGVTLEGANGPVDVAVYGMTHAVGFADVTDPENPVIIAVMNQLASTWHDTKIQKDGNSVAYVFSVTDSCQRGSDTSKCTGPGNTKPDPGIFIYKIDTNATPMVSHINTWNDSGIADNHNITEHPTKNLMLVSNDGRPSLDGFRILDTSDPTGPKVELAYWQDAGCHDLSVQVADAVHGAGQSGKDIVFCFGGSSQRVYIVDISTPSSPVTLGSTTYPGARYPHQGTYWIDTQSSKAYIYLNDELDETGGVTAQTKTVILDVTDLTSPFYAGNFLSANASIDHNCYAWGDYIFQAHYTSGLLISDLSADPMNPPLIGSFDTYTASNVAEFAGAWSVYQFQSSQTIVVSDIQGGLFVLRLEETDTDGDGVPDDQDSCPLIPNPCPDPENEPSPEPPGPDTIPETQGEAPDVGDKGAVVNQLAGGCNGSQRPASTWLLVTVILAMAFSKRVRLENR